MQLQGGMRRDPMLPQGVSRTTPGGDGVFGGHRSSWWGQPQVCLSIHLLLQGWLVLCQGCRC